MTKRPFSANSVISSFIATEDALTQFLRFVPYCEEHKTVWSPALATTILETCSQLDSLWQYEARQSPCVTKEKLTIKDYFQYYGQYVANKWLVFYGETSEKLQPYAVWAEAPQYVPEQYTNYRLQWWRAYNALKHNRFVNRSEGKLEYAVQALAGLFLSILRAESCRNAVAQAGWLFGEGHNLQANLGEDSPSVNSRFITAESRLFTYPVGWGKEPFLSRLDWQGPCSHRFRDWLDGYVKTQQDRVL